MANKHFSPFAKKVDDSQYSNPRNRDVYSEQDMNRGQLGRPVSAKVRMWGTAIASIFTFLVSWTVLTIILGLSMHIQSGGNYTFNMWQAWFVSGWEKFLISSFLTAIIGGLVGAKLWRNYAVQNVFNDHTDINQYQNDQHVATPNETMEKFDWFPDVGAHASPQVSSMISHVNLANKGINSVEAAQFYSEKDEKASGGSVLAGEHKLDDNGDIIFKKVPFFDKDFGEALFEASGITDKFKKYKKYYDTTKIKYMPDSPRDSVGKGEYKTVADYINADWELPYYEPQRPAGAYIVDTAPVVDYISYKYVKYN